MQQKDGNDQRAEMAASSLGVLVWSPDWTRHQAQRLTPAPPASANLEAPLDQLAIAAIAQKSANWQWQHVPAGKDYAPLSWTMAPFYLGNLAVARSMSNPDLEAKMLAWGDKLGWQPGKRIYHVDDHAVIQPFLHLYLKHRDPKMRAPSKERLDAILAHPAPSTLDWESPRNSDRWSWSDALFMAPMSWLLMHEATGEARYLDFMNREWWAATEQLYRPGIGMYFRDDSLLDLREQNGKPFIGPGAPAGQWRAWCKCSSASPAIIRITRATRRSSRKWQRRSWRRSRPMACGVRAYSIPAPIPRAKPAVAGLSRMRWRGA